MKTRVLDCCFLAVGVVGLLALVFVSAPVAQNAAPAAKAVPTPRLADGHPDFSGFYSGRHGDETRGALGSTLVEAGGSIYFDYGGANDGASYPALRENPNQPAYKPEYMAKVNALADSMYGGNSNLDPQLDCKP